MNTDVIVTIVLAALGATWALRSKLSDIESKLDGHVTRTDGKHAELEKRVVSLEEYRNARR